MTDGFILGKIALWAKKGLGSTVPNPTVAAALTLKDSLRCVGVHYGSGFNHAEVNALQYVRNKQLSEGVLYVTLEPCCHHGRRPPCVDAIVAAGIKKVVYGFTDPHPLVAGKGIAALMESGVQCTHVPTAAIDSLYAPYAHWCITGRPWVTAKLALSAEGAVAGVNGTPVTMTGNTFNRWVHEQRWHCDGILTTGRTVLQDNPALDARLNGERLPKILAIVDRAGVTPLDALCLQRAARVNFYTSHRMDRSHGYERQGVRCVTVPELVGDRLCLSAILDDLGRQGLHHVWVEAGPRLFMALHENQLLNRAIVARSPCALGPGSLLGLPQGFDVCGGAQSVERQWMGQDAVTMVNF